MKFIFEKPSLMILESLSFTKTLYAFDFDGTLSQIVQKPADARMSEATAALLERLSRVASVAVISGRSIEDLRKRLPFKPRFLVGNHGLEGLCGDRVHLKDAQRASKGWRQRLERVEWGTGVEIEDKVYSLAIHFRLSRNKGKAKALIKKTILSLSPAPRVIYGKSVVNLLPSGAPHKGVALLELMKQSGSKHAFYIGDDDTDEDVFALPETPIMSVRVGDKRKSLARYYIERQSQINRLLNLLIQYHEAPLHAKNAKRNRDG